MEPDFPFSVIERVLSFLPVGEILASLVFVNKEYRNVAITSKDVWFHSYALTWKVNTSLMDPTQNWKKIAIKRYQLQLARAPYLYHAISGTIQELLINNINNINNNNNNNPNELEKINFVHLLDAGLEHSYWVKNAKEELVLFFDSIDEEEYRFEDKRGKSIMNKMIPNIAFISSTRESDGQANRTVKANFAWYTTEGTMCGPFTYSHSYSEGDENFEKCISLSFQNKLVFSQSKFSKSTMEQMKFSLLGPQARKVSNEILVGILCNIGCSADKISDRCNFLFMRDLSDVYEEIIQGSRYKLGRKHKINYDKVEPMNVEVPQWIKTLIPHPIASFKRPKIKEADEANPYHGYDNIKLAQIKSVNPEDYKVPRPFQIGISDNAISKAVRLARFSVVVERQTRLWLKAAGGNLHLEKLIIPNFVVPIMAERCQDRDNMTVKLKELCQFALHSSVTGKSVAIVFFFSYVLENRDSYNPDELVIRFNEFTLLKCGGIITKDDVEEIKMRDEEYKNRMAYVLAMLKQSLFGSANVEITFEMCINFLCAIGRAATEWRYEYNTRLKRPYFPHQLHFWISRFVRSHTEAWEMSNKIIDAQLDSLKTDAQIKVEKLEQQKQEKEKEEAEKSAILNEKKIKAKEAPVITSENYPFCLHGWDSLEITPDPLYFIPHSPYVLVSNSCYLLNTSTWPISVSNSGLYLRMLEFSSDGRRIAGIREVLKIENRCLIQQDLFIYELSNLTAPVIIISGLERQKGEVVGIRRFAKDRLLKEFGSVGVKPIKKNNKNNNNYNYYNNYNNYNNVEEDHDWSESESESDFNEECDHEMLDADEEEEIEGRDYFIDEYGVKVRVKRGLQLQKVPIPIGFIAQRLLLGGCRPEESGALPYYLQKSPSEPIFKKTNLPVGNSVHIFVLPLRELTNYAPEAVCVGNTCYQFNLQKNSFERINSINEKGEPFDMVTPLQEKGCFAVTKEKRVFYIQYLRLYEITWSTQQPNTIVCTEHIPGICKVRYIQDAGSLGLLLVKASKTHLYCQTFKDEDSKLSKNDIACVIYQPTPGTNEGLLRTVPLTMFGRFVEDKKCDINLIWSEIQKKLILVDDELLGREFRITSTCFTCRVEVEKENRGAPWEEVICKDCKKKKKRDSVFPDEKIRGKTIFLALEMDSLLNIPPLKSNVLTGAQLGQNRGYDVFSPKLSKHYQVRNMAESRSEKIFFPKYELKYQHYLTCFAVWGKTPNIIPSTYLVPPSEQKIFDSPAELVKSYLGGPIVYVIKTTNGDPTKYFGNILDFAGFQTSAVAVISYGREECRSVKKLNLSSLLWIGVADFFPEHSSQKKGLSTLHWDV